MIVKYDEYDYLRLCVDWRYFAQLEALIDPIHEAHKEAIASKDWDKAFALEALQNKAQNQLIEQRLRARDIIFWLQIDNDLRRHDLSYAGVMET